MSKIPDPATVAKRTIEILGGMEQLEQVIQDEFGNMTLRWDQDIDSIGRILRAHLYVEFYMTEYLQKSNPNLGPLRNAKLGFAQKLALLQPDDPQIKEVMEGLKHLNTIRNRLAHRLNATVDSNDSAIFLRAGFFDAMRKARVRPDDPSKDPLDILEDFAQHASSALTHKFSVLGTAFAQALDDCKDSADK